MGPQTKEAFSLSSCYLLTVYSQSSQALFKRRLCLWERDSLTVAEKWPFCTKSCQFELNCTLGRNGAWLDCWAALGSRDQLYLSNRNLSVTSGNLTSSTALLDCGVPLNTHYVASWTHVTLIQNHFYADDYQLSMRLKKKSANSTLHPSQLPSPI